MRTCKTLFLIIFTIVIFNFSGSSEVIEEIYAVVNGEIITHSEIKAYEAEMLRMLRSRYQNEKLIEEVGKMKKSLVDTLINQKLILSKAKEKNYEIDQQVEIYIKEIMKENNIKTEEELKQAVASQGGNFNEWKKSIKDMQIQQRLVYEEIGSKINVDNAEIMSYYKNNIKEYTKPQEISLNCIFLNKEKYLDNVVIREKTKMIDSELNDSNFEETAKKYSDLPDKEDKHFLGTFKKGELNSAIEEAALKLKKGELSPWIETDNGWYLIQMVKIKESQLVEYKEVREKIETLLRTQKQNEELKKYIEKLKKESYIKIYKEYE